VREVTIVPLKLLALSLVAPLSGVAVPILLPIAGMSINFALLVSAGAIIGFMSGLLGVGGGFLMTPILMMIGVPPTVAAASDTNAIVATSASGVAAHFRLKNVDLRMGTVCLVGGLCGSAVGVQAIKILRALGNADLLITFMYIVVLSGVGSFTLRDSIKKLRRGVLAPQPKKTGRRYLPLDRLPLQMEFARSGVRHSILVPFCLCSMVGIMTAVMGVGGGFIMVPMMVYLLRMPAHVAVGTDLFQILFTCIGVTLMQAATNHTVDVVLAILIAAGSTIGAQIGARVSKRLRGEQLLMVLGVLALAVGLRMAVGVVVPPANPLSGVGGHAGLRPDGRATVAQLWYSRGR
jgi:hypothetical protein